MRSHLRVLFPLSLIAAVIDMSFAVRTNELMPIGFDYLLILLYLMLPYLVISTVAAIILSVLINAPVVATSMASTYERTHKLLLPVACYLIVLNFGVGAFRLDYYARPPGSRSVVFIVFGFIVVLLTILLFLSFRYYDHFSSRMRRVGLSPFRVSLLCTIIVFVALSFQSLTGEGEDTIEVGDVKQDIRSAGDDSESRPKILLLGLDCLSLDSIERLSREGRLPNLEALIDNGSSGYLQTATPTLSPMLWTSISTGKVQGKHGIHDFRTVKFPGVRPFKTTLRRVEFLSLLNHYVLKSRVLSDNFYSYRYYTSTMRSCRSLWNILSENGLSVGVVGWYVSWPAEPVKGFIVSDRSFFFFGESGEVDSNLTYPEELFSKLRGQTLDSSDFSEDSLDWLCEPPEGGRIGWREDCLLTLSNYFTVLRENWVRDNNTLRISTLMMENYKSWDVLILYFRAVDSMNHVVLHHLHQVSDEMDDSLYIIPDNYYVFVDSIVGELKERIDEKTILMVVSDHGWDRGSGHPYAPAGAFITTGKYIEKGCRVGGAGIYDITPTILYLLGLPVAEDMDGRPVISCLTPDFVDNNPLKYISTYEGAARPDRTHSPNSKMDKVIEDELKALGYID
jgi:predicted AlkP superfamily phosphohydrolase/phosphomutase